MSNQTVIEMIRQRDVLNVGVSLGFRGLSFRNAVKNCWEGFDIDLARAVAVAVFGDAGKIHYMPLQSGDRFRALRDGVIDLGSFNSSITFQREAESEVTFVHPMLFDGEVLMTPASNLLEPVEQASYTRKRRIAAMRGSTTEENLKRYFGNLNLSCEISLFDSPSQARQAYQHGECNIYCLDSYLLAGERAQLTDKEAHIILQDRISLETMSPAVASNDPQWLKAVTWIMRALIEAENLQVSSKNIHEMSQEATGYLKTFLYPSEQNCKNLGLRPEFIREIIHQVGNYGEIFQRNLGKYSELNQARRDNNLWSQGGMLYSPLFI
ncbi:MULTISPECIES: amino acid ABC transporter substrate-binding protein [Rahnella]|jgi:ABC-type amino acid transport substrate-binding protein|uniref:Amino acid ABC transporter substrate-binding protein n=1 Tax=Rahnella contaminans TaxID=2703882 RepID=A0A6M2B704_9GAMM|nr:MULTISPECIES: amino acid ABC transporter substrate-binding protein [Rahnella]KAB8307825.1 amino acid ABC transporter substrate-binding protein [Rouxiella chamberiensis]MBU9821869.1 amino acid ABC transporter substrate-binding protein [Rahnella sp. BCC 1045]MCS3424603.1 polar amino acid transport system substrate-binding protein [Rahnella sp. BIGb0603]MDF1895342.1 amino acid ABC transporter substrate-binding protein [Rahnella contaminans]NGX88391.1 amino acid ABC transporter substrate-bindin